MYHSTYVYSLCPITSFLCVCVCVCVCVWVGGWVGVSIMKFCAVSLLLPLQVTFQACCVDEARHLYDQLSVIAPIIVSTETSVCCQKS